MIYPIPAFSDNYIWCLSENGAAVVVDPGDDAPVHQYLQEQGLTLAAILITHHHYDHVGGIKGLVDAYPGVTVYGPENACPDITHRLADGDELSLLGHRLSVLAVPGHTLDHIAYFCDEPDRHLVFCGDTLFAGGCGRLFEGTPAVMLKSLQKLMALPKQTAIYCTHEYTLANLQFAIEVEPGNSDLQQRLLNTQDLRQRGTPTLPSTLDIELRSNPFLRTDEASVRQPVIEHAQLEHWDDTTIFGQLRAWKDTF